MPVKVSVFLCDPGAEARHLGFFAGVSYFTLGRMRGAVKCLRHPHGLRAQRGFCEKTGSCDRVCCPNCVVTCIRGTRSRSNRRRYLYCDGCTVKLYHSALYSVKKEGVVYPRHLPGGLATLRGDGGSGNGVAQMV